MDYTGLIIAYILLWIAYILLLALYVKEARDKLRMLEYVEKLIEPYLRNEDYEDEG